MTWRTRFNNWPGSAITAREAGEIYRAAAAGAERNGDHERAAALRKQARMAERRDRIGEWSHHG